MGIFANEWWGNSRRSRSLTGLDRLGISCNESIPAAATIRSTSWQTSTRHPNQQPTANKSMLDNRLLARSLNDHDIYNPKHSIGGAPS